MKYYAIRIANMVVIRRTVKGLQKITSTITNSAKTLKLTQISYIGGKVIGVIPYDLWTSRQGRVIADRNCLSITKETFLKFKPIMTWTRTEND